MRHWTQVRLAALCLWTGLSCAQTAEPRALMPKGRVQLTGSIVVGGCSIRVGSDNQTVSLPATALQGLLRGDGISQQPLRIEISGCFAMSAQDQADPRQLMRVVFDGEGSEGYFSTQGDARGVALQIRDSNGKPIVPGTVLQGSHVAVDRLTLDYVLALVGDGATLASGEFRATVRLVIQHL
ncbi:fimbrial protein [Pseudomonas sp. WC1]|uniref:fimbrial protein n=1 Tax=Pseudomonas sp. WC1 TaxID=3424772 RepID=UPI003D331BC6